MTHLLNTVEIEAGMPNVQASPADKGRVEMIIARPTTEERTVLETGSFSLENGLDGDNWLDRGSKRTDDGSAHPEMQVTLMNARFLDLIAGSRERWPLAGDQLVVDLDLSQENLQPGQQIKIGTAVFEVTPMPHTGCKKFRHRFGMDAIKFVASENGKQLRLRGIYVKVVQPGTVQVQDTITKI